MRIAIVAGETSGDLLGGALIEAIKTQVPEAEFVGIAGPRMIAAGCQAWYPAEKLAVMGLVEVLAHLPEILSIRRRFRQRLLADPPDLFIGIDAPDFNLALEEKLHRNGIKTVHYVSPSIWAWRPERVVQIGRAVDLMLTLFPFEASFYEQHNVPVKFVGHPLANMIDLEIDQSVARQALGFTPDDTVIALLPGSRRSELKYLTDTFLETAAWCHQRQPELRFVVPLANAKRRAQFEQGVARLDYDLPIMLLDGQSHQAMGAADVVLTASGTATLEALLLKRPMVVAYRLSRFTYHWMLRKLKVKHYSLPNHLTPEPMVPELIQDDATPEKLGQALLRYLQDDQAASELKQAFTQVHQQLRCDASVEAAKAVLGLLKKVT